MYKDFIFPPLFLQISTVFIAIVVSVFVILGVSNLTARQLPYLAFIKFILFENNNLSGLDRMISELQAFSKNSAVQVNLQVSQHSNSVVVSLQSQLAHITMDFKEVLVSRTESIKEQKQRRDQFRLVSCDT